jgi:uncharacterized BrkB/YihY/UPF0761 family membrane protein
MFEVLIILVILAGSIGLTLYFVGWINCIFMALGKDQIAKAIIIFILNPVAIFICYKIGKNKKNKVYK